jgi:hypothetical protein
MSPAIPPRKATLAFSTGILIILILLINCSGCVNKILQKGSESSLPDNRTGVDNSGDLSLLNNTIGPTGSQFPEQVAEMRPIKSEIAMVVSPILTPDPYPIIHGTRINETPQYRFLDRLPEFERTYYFDGNATGLLVNVVEGPLYIVYTVTPQHDCLKNPDSCRGNMVNPVQRPYLKITVRDNQTKEIVAEDGYGREFSSDTGNYVFIITGENMDGLLSSGFDGSEGSNTVTPGPRRIIIYKEGSFHITMEGNYIGVHLSIITGSSPDPVEAQEAEHSGLSSLKTPLSEDEFD